jgi:segregation and condensation protein B
MSMKAKVEAIIYATEEPVTLNQLASLLKDAVVAEMRAAAEAARLALNETATGHADPEENEEAGLPRASSQPVPAQEPPAPASASELTAEEKKAAEKQEFSEVKAHISDIVARLMAEYARSERGMEIREIAGGYRMATKPEHHDVVVTFAKSLKPPVRLSLPALETLSVIAYKQPVTVPEISEIRGVDAAGVIATLLDRKLVTTAGRKQVIGRPILYKTTKEFLLRFGLKDLSELPSVEEFEKLGEPQAELFAASTTTAEVRETDDTKPIAQSVPRQASGENSVSVPEDQSEGADLETKRQTPPPGAEAPRE